jgi:hypothetical protein
LKTYGSTSSNNPAVKVIITIVVMNENKNDCEVTTVPRRMSHHYQRLKLDYVNVVMCNNNVEVRRMFSIGTFIFLQPLLIINCLKHMAQYDHQPKKKYEKVMKYKISQNSVSF